MVVNFSIYKRQGKYPTCPMHSCISSLLVRNFACTNDWPWGWQPHGVIFVSCSKSVKNEQSPCDLVAPYSSWVAKESDQHFQLSFSPHFWSSTLYHPQHIIVNQSINYSMESCRAVCLQNHYTSIQRTSSTKGTERQRQGCVSGNGKRTFAQKLCVTQLEAPACSLLDSSRRLVTQLLFQQ